MSMGARANLSMRPRVAAARRISSRDAQEQSASRFLHLAYNGTPQSLGDLLAQRDLHVANAFRCCRRRIAGGCSRSISIAKLSPIAPI